VDGTDPAEFDSLPDAAGALRGLLSVLNLDPEQARAFAWFCSDPARIQDFLDRGEPFRLDFTTDDGQPHAAVIDCA
jgi:hypothetical protein